MKILRHHRGFTTNSSAASEWVWKPPAWADQGEANDDGQPGQPAPGGEQENSGLLVKQPDHDAAAQPDSPLGGNLLVLGGLLLSVLGIFALERIVRRAIKARRDHDDV